MITDSSKIIWGRWWLQGYTKNILFDSSSPKICWSKNIFLHFFFFLILLLDLLEGTESLTNYENERQPSVLEERTINTNKYNYHHYHHHRNILNKYSNIFEENHHIHNKQKHHHKKNHKRRSLHLHSQKQQKEGKREEESVEIPSARRPRRLFIKKPFWPWP
ncbi:hypothetical protein ACQ4LE_003144 [Meloidogyne hapla]